MYTDKQTSDCDWVQDRLEEYLDGGMSRADLLRLAEHCTGCEDCAVELELATAIREGLDALPILRAPDSVTERVFETIGAQSQVDTTARPRFLTLVKPLWRPVSIAASVAAVLLMMLVQVDTSPQRFSDEEIDRALIEAKYALGVISDVGRQTGAGIREGVGDGVIRPMQRVFDDNPANGS